jgi:hypothetical protein
MPLIPALDAYSRGIRFPEAFLIGGIFRDGFSEEKLK